MYARSPGPGPRAGREVPSVSSHLRHTAAAAIALCEAASVLGQGRPAVGPPPARLRLDPSYRKHVDAGGIPVVASGVVPDAALLAARDLAVRMLAKRPDV